MGISVYSTERYRPLIDTDVVISKASGDGIMVDPAVPTFGWRDIIGDIVVRALGANDPTFSVFRGNLRAFEFSATAMKEVFMVFHVPHDYVPGTDIYFHAHWANAAATPNTGNVVWGFEYSFAKGYNQEPFAAPATVTVTQACPAARYQHNIAETAAVTVAGMEVDGLLLVRVYRDGAAGGDTCTDTAFLFTADIHYQSTNMATKQRNGPNFYT